MDTSTNDVDHELFRALHEMSAAEYILAIELTQGKREMGVLIEMAREIEQREADFVTCLANGTGFNLAMLRSQALDELKAEFPVVFKFLEEFYGKFIGIPTFSKN
jgi:hypothetical protein